MRIAVSTRRFGRLAAGGRAAALLSLIVLGSALPAASLTSTIEWMVFDAAVVVRGTVVGARTLPGAKVANDIITARVVETIKGRPLDSITFLAEVLSGQPWDDGEYLFFLEPTTRYTTGPVFADPAATVDAFPWVCKWRIALDAPRVEPHYDGRFRRLDTADAILTAVRREAARRPNAAQSFRFDVTIHPDTPLPPSGSDDARGRDFRMLLDDRLAEIVRPWTDSPDARDRVNGVWALSRFESADNVARVSALLNDPYSTPDTVIVGSDFIADNGRGKWAGAPYLVRHAACQALRGWGIAVPPGTVLNRPKYPTAFLPRWGPAALVAAVVVPFLSCAGGIIVARRRWRWVAGMSLLLLLASGALWLLGTWRIAEFAFTSGGGDRYELATWDGKVRVMRIERFDDPLPDALTTAARSDVVDADWDPDYAGGIRSRVTRWGTTFDRGQVMCAGISYRTFAAFSLQLRMPCVLFGVAPLQFGVATLRRRRRGAQGRCPQCGYDLRATPVGCPECGWGR